MHFFFLERKITLYILFYVSHSLEKAQSPSHGPLCHVKRPPVFNFAEKDERNWSKEITINLIKMRFEARILKHDSDNHLKNHFNQA